MVESVGESSAPGAAGLRPGDVLLAWRRPPAPPANRSAAAGDLDTPFDLLEMIREQAPRGPVELRGTREGEPLRVEVPRGDWQLRCRPSMEAAIADRYTAALKRLPGAEAAAGIAALDELASLAGGDGNKVLAAWLHFRIGRSHIDRWELPAAQQAFASALEALADVEDPVARREVRLHVALSHDFADDFDVAQEIWRSELPRARAGGVETLTAAELVHRMSVVAWVGDDLNRAEELTVEALAIRERLAPGSLEHALSLANLGMLRQRRGRLAEAESLGRRSYDIRRRLTPEGPAMARALSGLGHVAMQLGEPDQARDYYEQALELSRRLKVEERELALRLSHLSAALLRLGDLEEAERLERRSLEIRARIAPRSQDHAASLGALADLLQAAGSLDEVRPLLEQALEMQIAITGDRSLTVAGTQIDLGGLAMKGGDLQAARAHYEIALPIVLDLAPGTTSEASVRHALGTIARREGGSEEALRQFLAALTALESQVGNLGGTLEQAASFRARYSHYYRDLIELLLEVGRPEDAFHQLERSRARVLLAMFADRELYFRDPDMQTLARRKRAVDADYGAILAELASLSAREESFDGRRAELQLKLGALRRQQDEVRGEIRATSPRHARLEGPEPLDLAGTRAALEPGTLLLSYLIGPDVGWLFAVGPGPDEFAVHRIALGEAELARQVEAYRVAIRTMRSGKRRSSLQRSSLELGRTLLGPVAEALSRAARLRIAPDGPLWSLPFAALGDPSHDERHLVEATPLALTTSVTVLAHIRESAPVEPGSTSVVAFGSTRDPAALTRTPEAPVTLRGSFPLRPLPGARAEVERLAEIFPDGSRVYLDSEATEERVKSLAGGYRVVHLAAHGIIDDRFPLESAIALAVPEAPARSGENGLLQAWEIFEGVRIETDLVTLSACETALGRHVAGEGIIGLARAFQFAGARSVLASIWKVEDRSTAALMEHFYRALRDGAPPDEALQRAQLEMLQGERAGSAVFQWAGFRLIGDRPAATSAPRPDDLEQQRR